MHTVRLKTFHATAGAEMHIAGIRLAFVRGEHISGFVSPRTKKNALIYMRDGSFLETPMSKVSKPIWTERHVAYSDPEYAYLVRAKSCEGVAMPWKDEDAF